MVVEQGWGNHMEIDYDPAVMDGGRAALVLPLHICTEDLGFLFSKTDR